MNSIAVKLLNIYYSEMVDHKFPYINIENNYNKLSVCIYDNYHGYMLGKYLYITIAIDNDYNYILKTLLNKYDLNLDCIKYRNIIMDENELIKLFTNNLQYLYKGGN